MLGKKLCEKLYHIQHIPEFLKNKININFTNRTDALKSKHLVTVTQSNRYTYMKYLLEVDILCDHSVYIIQHIDRADFFC